MTVPSEISIGMEEACVISVECWRLQRILQSEAGIDETNGLRHIVRRLTNSLEAMGLRTLDFQGRIYDAGMVLDVIEVRDDSTVPDGCTMIDETVMPTLLWHGQVVRPGQVVVKRSPAKSLDKHEAAE